MVFQDPFASLDPRFRIGGRSPSRWSSMAWAAAASGPEGPRAARARRPPAEAAHRYPHEFSGGQRQRIGIARAIALHPKLLVADEPVSALDVSIQSQILNLLVELRARLALSYLFISHDLAVVRYVSHRIAVMYLGQIVELGAAAAIYRDAAHPYTQALLSAIPQPDPERRRTRIVLTGDVPNPEQLPPGCPFHPRCPRAFERCRSEPPAERNLGSAALPHLVRCHLY